MPENIFRKRMTILATALAVCLCLVGCGKKQTPDPESYLNFLTNTPEVEALTPTVTETPTVSVTEKPTESVPDPEIGAEKDTPQYILNPIVKREMFELSVYIPEDYPVEITEFELWADEERIGERTPIDKSLRHLALSKEKTSEVFIRFYNGSEFVCDCTIDPAEEKGVLNIPLPEQEVRTE